MINESELIQNEFYWIKWNGTMYFSMYSKGYFTLLGNDRNPCLWMDNIEVIEKAQLSIPEYINLSKLG